ncbi:SIMPL domain-containing protein [Methylovirgula sp. HY1]|uniref:SIMPL domain-containing protein n=1 Tax=Methylovirgula sp. HY1 TaxID=2822761 RepID=UPI001C5B56AD|nr:SIMPL domain-containing protein [Methylovirgula sp. HY1]QXX75691.1 26 kDa periplasmic immunogenic protein [Methylovirgula sp. HY1]
MPVGSRPALLSGLCLAACLALAPSVARAQTTSVSQISHITVTGRAHMAVVPDVATLSLAVITEKPKAADAESANATAVQALIQDIKAQGIDTRDIKTVSLTLAPVYSEQRDLVRQITNQVLRGYRARNALTIRVRNLDKASTLARQLIGKGANEFYGIHFDYTHKKEAYDKLRGAAVEDALRQANAYLAPLGLKLGRVLEIAPPENPGAARARMPTFAAISASGAAPASIPIEAGTQKLSAQVQVTWEIK